MSAPVEKRLTDAEIAVLVEQLFGDKRPRGSRRDDVEQHNCGGCETCLGVPSYSGAR